MAMAKFALKTLLGVDRPAMAAVGGTPPHDPKEPETAPTKPTRLTITPRVPSLRELPRAFRESLPEVRITVHVYDPDPRARMVRINRRKLREGQRTKSGLQVDEITPTGLIVTYKNTQFRMPIQ
jgi:general secretion pathway protein B